MGLFEIDVASLLKKYKSQEFIDPTLIADSSATVAKEAEKEALDFTTVVCNNGEIIDEFLEWTDVLKEEVLRKS